MVCLPDVLDASLWLPDSNKGSGTGRGLSTRLRGAGLPSRQSPWVLPWACLLLALRPLALLTSSRDSPAPVSLPRGLSPGPSHAHSIARGPSRNLGSCKHTAKAGPPRHRQAVGPAPWAASPLRALGSVPVEGEGQSGTGRGAWAVTAPRTAGPTVPWAGETLPRCPGFEREDRAFAGPCAWGHSSLQPRSPPRPAS